MKHQDALETLPSTIPDGGEVHARPGTRPRRGLSGAHSHTLNPVTPAPGFTLTTLRYETLMET